jgi:hypothetical protein
MCTYDCVSIPVAGSAKGAGGPWFEVTRATVSFDHPVHAPHVHALNVDLLDPARGPARRVAVELDATSARELADAILAALAAAPDHLTATVARCRDRHDSR